jgi:hypothetical protein
MFLQKIFLFLAVVSLKSDRGIYQKIEVIGKAINAKAGAVVVTDDERVFYLDELDKWNENFYEKRVKVTGKLRIKKLKLRNGIEVRGEIEGPQKIIKRPKWVLVN